MKVFKKSLLVFLLLLVGGLVFGFGPVLADCCPCCTYDYTWCGCCGYDCGGGETDDPTCECSETQCCQADSSCGPCGSSGEWKGRHAWFFVDHPLNNVTFPSLTWNDEVGRIWTDEDRVPAFESRNRSYFPVRYTGQVGGVFWGADSKYSSEDGETGYDNKIGIQIREIDKAVDWSSQSADADAKSEHDRVSIVSYPSSLKTQGYRPPGLYTIEPIAQNISMTVRRTYKSGESLAPIIRAKAYFDFQGYFLNTDWDDFQDNLWPRDGVWFESRPFVLASDFNNMSCLLDGSHCNRDASMHVIDDIYYAKLNESTGTWSTWAVLPGRSVSLQAGTYKLKAKFQMERTSRWGINCWNNSLVFSSSCSEILEPLTGRLYCPDNNTETGTGRFILPGDSRPGYTAFAIPGEPYQINYTFTWNFRPNYTGTVLIRLLDSNVSAGGITSRLYLLNEDGSRGDEITSTALSVRVGQPHNDLGASYRLTLGNLDRTKKYQLRMNGWARNCSSRRECSGYYNTSFFAFLFANPDNRFITRGRCYDLDCAFLGSIGIEDGAEYMFIPFINETPIKGTVVGNVYQTSDNTCTGTDVPDSADDWQAFCRRSEDADPSYKDALVPEGSTSQFSCWLDDTGEFDTGNSYTVKVETSSNWQFADCSPALEVITVQGGVNQVGPFYIWQGGDPWLQTVDGDVGAQGSLAFSLPSDEYLAIVDQADTPGVVSYQTSSDFGEGASSTEEWLAETALSPKGRTFSGFMTLLGDPEAGEESFPNLSSLSTGTYFYDNDISIGSGDNLSGGNKVILLVGGDVTIDADLTVAEDDFLAIIASGNITFTSEVTQSQGIFFAGDQIIITESETQFLGEGMFLAANGFSFGRDLETSFNLEPAEIFTFRPDLLINSPSGLWVTPQTWQEVAP